MYYYIVDGNRISTKEFERVQSDLYSSISEYHISGEIVRVTGIRTVKQLVETAFFHQAKTIVAVGNDETLNEVIDLVKGRETTIGYIPLVKTELSEVLGIPDVAQACKFLAVRRVETLDLGIINEKYFLSKLSFGANLHKTNFDLFGLSFASELSKKPTINLKFKIDNNYQAECEVLAGLILNSRGESSTNKIGNPADETLDLLLLPKASKSTLLANSNQILQGNFEKIPNSALIHFKQLEILEPVNLPILLGGTEIGITPAKISIKPKAVKVIVGKDRKF
jgi:diacylglycerol kinase family enzyme